MAPSEEHSQVLAQGLLESEVDTAYTFTPEIESFPYSTATRKADTSLEKPDIILDPNPGKRGDTTNIPDFFGVQE